jgi:glycosyltransferase involved in cell wall biosynthesis
LYSFSKSAHKNFEVIIVDDASNEDNRIEGAIALGQYDFPIKIVTIKPSEKTWLNPSAAYNIGVTYATKQIVVMQNAEVAFIGDVLSYIARHLNPKDWMTFNCYGLDASKSEGIRSMIDDHTSAFKTVCQLPNKVGGNSVENKDPSGWLNHYEKHFVAYHYCGAIYKSDLEIYMNGGFSKDFYQLVGADDDEFVKRLLFNMFNFKIGEFKEGTPFVIHQYHEPSEAVSSWSKDKYRETMLAFAKSCIKMGFKPENNIALAPKTEIPMSRRSIVH